MTHSNWNNAVAVHIGSNAGIAIDKLTTITTEDKTRLLEQYRKIQDYCDRKNDELGLDIFTDATAYRFALVVPLTGLPKFIQLPDFDTYDYSEVMGTKKQTLETSADAVIPAAIVCPHCGSEKFRKHSKTTRAHEYRYLCSNVECKKTFTASTLTNSN
jgi:predicted RNA-binding Zn-ribbon protein involved in translation (DUF1610 family)